MGEPTARGLLGNESAIGKRVAQTGIGHPLEWAEIVGIAADVNSVTPENPP